MAKLTIELGATIGKLKRGLANARSELQNWGKRVAKLGKVGLAVGAGALAAGLATLSKRAVELAAKFQQTQVAFNAMLGDSQKAASLIEALTEFSTKTPFSPEKVQQAAKTLLSFGFTAEEVKKTLKPLGDVAAGTGKDFQELAVIFGQIKSAGRLMGQDLLQLINAGFNPLQVMSEKTGKSVMQLKDDMSKGLITFDQVEQAFIDATSAGGLFNDMMAKQSETVIGKVSTLKGNFDELLKTLGSGSTGFLSTMVGELNEAVKAMQEFADAGEKATGATGGLSLFIKEYAKSVNPLLRRFDFFKTSEEQAAPSVQEIKAGLETREKQQAEAAVKQIEDAKKREDALFDNGDFQEQKGFYERLADVRARVEGEAMRKVQEEQMQAASDLARAGLQEGIAASTARAAELEASIAQAFRPQGEIASGLARIGGERGITLARNVPEKQLTELQAIRKGIDIMGNQLEKIDGKAVWPGGN